MSASAEVPMRLALLIGVILASTAPETRAQTIDQIRDGGIEVL